jgi:hypothetical protein
MFNSQALPTVPTAVRTRPFCDRSDRLVTSDFVDMEMNKTVSSSQDIIDLEVIHSQVHHNKDEHD